MRQYLGSLKCIHEIMLCPTITLSLAIRHCLLTITCLYNKAAIVTKMVVQFTCV